MNQPIPRTIAEALQRVATDSTITPGYRRQWRVALSTLARLHDRPAETIALNSRESIALMESDAPAALGLSAGSMANYRAGLRGALRHFGLLARPAQRASVQDPAWLALLEQLPPMREFERVRAFVQWLAQGNIRPAMVNQTHLDAFLKHREATRGGSKQVSHARRLISVWRRAVQDIPGWPQAGLVNPKPAQLSLPLDAYPAPLSEEAETYLAAIAAPPDIFDDKPATNRRPVSPATVASRRHGVRILLQGAHEGGIPMERLNQLRCLLDLDILKASFRWHMARKGLLADKKIDAHLMTVVATVFSVANYLQISADERQQLKAFLDRLELKAQPDGLIDRYERILAALDDIRTRAMLLHLPRRLMQQAYRLRNGWTHKGIDHAPQPKKAAWLAGIAIAIEIELHAPLRVNDLGHLRLGQELRLTPPGKGRAAGTLHLERSSKTGRGLQVPLQPESLALLHEYLEQFRPLLPYANGIWLFPGEVSADLPRAITGLGTAITETISQYLGIRINPHAFRAIAGALILEANPNAIDDVRALLGHSTFVTALRFYRRFSTREAANRLGQAISGLRRSSRHLAQPVPRVRAKGTIRKGRRGQKGGPR